MRRLSLAVVALMVLIGPAVWAGDHDGARRFAISVGIGTFDEQGSDIMLRKDGEPGNPIVGWMGSDQVAAAFAYDLRPGLTVDLSYARLDYDFGTDLITTGSYLEPSSTQIATGNMDEYRLTVMFDMDMLGENPTYFVSPQRTSKWRFAMFLAVSMTTAGDVDMAETGRELLGIESIDTGSQSAAGFGAQFDYRLGRSGFTIGADVGWMWKVTGDLFAVNTTPDSPYQGTTLAHEGLNFLVDLAFHF